jgi:hypothetical protein
MRRPRATVLSQPAARSGHERKLDAEDQLPPEHRLNQSFGAIEGVVVCHGI